MVINQDGQTGSTVGMVINQKVRKGINCRFWQVNETSDGQRASHW